MFEWTPGVGDRQGGLVCCDSWGRKESDMTERLNWTELNWMTKDVECLFSCSAIICVFYLVRCLLRSFTHFQHNCLICYYWFLRDICIFWIQMIYHICVLQIFPLTPWHFFKKFFLIYLFYFSLCWVFIAVLTSLFCGGWASHCGGFCFYGTCTGSRDVGPVVVTCGL